MRFLTDSTGAITDTYDYDAFGNLISSTGSTPNNYLFAGEQFDPALGIYYNRARYYDQRQGRFWTMDTFEGDPQSPASLHKYLYVNDDSVNRRDPGGQDSMLDISVANAIQFTLAANSVISLASLGLIASAGASSPPSGIVASVRLNASGTPYGLTAGGGVDLFYDFRTAKLSFAAAFEGGTNPLSIFNRYKGFGVSATFGLAWGVNDPSDLSQFGFQAVWPLAAFRTLAGVFRGTKDPFASLGYLARLTNNVKLTHAAVVFGFSPGGAAYFEAGPRSNAFSSLISYTGTYRSGADLLQMFGCSTGGSVCQYLSDMVQAMKTSRTEDDIATMIDRFNQ